MTAPFTHRVSAVAAAIYEHFSPLTHAPLDLQLIKDRAAQIVIGVDALAAFDRQHGGGPAAPLSGDERNEYAQRLRALADRASMGAESETDLWQIIADLERG